MFIFRITDPSDASTSYILHTGDFRADPEAPFDSFPRDIPHLEAIYLDTTYSDPQYTFPAQAAVIAECCGLVERLILRADQRQATTFAPRRRLILVGSYLIGKERLALAIARHLGGRIYCAPRKRAILNCLRWPALAELLTNEPEEAIVHLVSMGDLEAETIGAMLNALWPRFTHALAIRPTGWSFKSLKRSPVLTPSPSSSSPLPSSSTASLTFVDHIRRDPHGQPIKRKDAIAIYSVAYSEHSSYHELIEFLSSPSLPPHSRIIPTVDNPLDCYLHPADYPTTQDLLLAWNHYRQNRREIGEKDGGLRALTGSVPDRGQT